MQHTHTDTQFTAGDVRQLQIKWGTPKLLQIGDVFKVRAFGQLEVGVRDPQRLADHVSTEDASALSAAAQGRLKELAVQALQAALAQCDVAAFAADEGACPPDCLAQVTSAVSADLGAQFADLGFDLRAFVITGCSYERLDRAVSPIDGPVPGAVRMPPGLEVPFQSSAVGLGYAQGLGAELLAKLRLHPGEDKDDADA